MLDSHQARAAELLGQVRALQALATAITTRAAELAGASPARQATARFLVNAAGQFLAVVSRRLGCPVGAPSIHLVSTGPARPCQHGHVTVLQDLRTGPAIHLSHADTGLGISVGRLDDGRPFVEVTTTGYAGGWDPAGKPYMEIGLDNAELYVHRPGQAAPSYQPPAADERRQRL